MKDKLQHVKCKKCGEKWIPRVSAPKKCPGCQSREWDLPVAIYRPVASAARKQKPKK